MPSAPLYYQPLVRAQIAMTPVGDTTIGKATQEQLNFSFKDNPNGGERYFNPDTDAAKKFAEGEYASAFAQVLTGVENIQNTLTGSTPLSGMKIAKSQDGWIANRVNTTFDNHPDMLDTLSPAQAVEMAKNLSKQAEAELSEEGPGRMPGMKYAGGVLEVSPDVMNVLEKAWLGKDALSDDEASYLGFVTARELQRAVTPTAPDIETKVDWIEKGTANLLATWTGVISNTVKALGVKHDEKGVKKAEQYYRMGVLQDTKDAKTNASLLALLEAGGIDGGKPEALAAAYKVLQGSPLEGVPNAIADALVSTAKLPPAAVPYFGERIVETAGSPGNIKGLLAELELAKPAPPPGTEPPPDNGGEPPPKPPSSDFPPDASTPPPVEELPPDGPPPVDPDKYTDLDPNVGGGSNTEPPPTQPTPPAGPADDAVPPPTGSSSGVEGEQPAAMDDAALEALIKSLSAGGTPEGQSAASSDTEDGAAEN